MAITATYQPECSNTIESFMPRPTVSANRLDLILALAFITLGVVGAIAFPTVLVGLPFIMVVAAFALNACLMVVGLRYFGNLALKQFGNK